MAGVAETNGASIDQWYPTEDPATVSELLEVASRTDMWDEAADEARKTLGDMFRAPGAVNLWHRDAMVGIATTHYRIGDREALMYRALTSLDTIATQAQQDAHFMFFEGHGRVTTGLLGDLGESIRTDEHQGLRLATSGTCVQFYAADAFPKFNIHQREHVELPLSARMHTDRIADFYEKIARGQGDVVFGAKRIATSVEHRGGFTAFTAAVALRAANFDIPIQIEPLHKLEAGQKLAASIGYIAAGLSDPLKLDGMKQRTWQVIADVAEASPEVVLHDATARLRYIDKDPDSTVADKRKAQLGLSLLPGLVEDLFS